MLLKQKVAALIALGKFLQQFGQTPFLLDRSLPDGENKFHDFISVLRQAEQQNGWFTSDNLQFACQSWASALTEKNIEKWLSEYDFSSSEKKTVAVIMAGNIPLVGLHDFLSVLVSGHRALVKLSSNDRVLLPFLADYLAFVEPLWQENYIFTEERMTDFDAVIATGSNNTARYFGYYFGQKPHIIRKNRHSLAVLTGNESKEELYGLGEDIFRYFGLGCRSVSKLFVPCGYDFDLFFNAIFPYGEIINNAKYANNYDYNKAVYLMSLSQLLENGFLMLKEDESGASPIATIFYEYYENMSDLQTKIRANAENIQCIVAKDFSGNDIPFGKTQQPELWEYADGVDTVSFLTNLNKKTY
ncbi:MAG: acyl-CoA reductase [Capnocytophaga sp.]|nr:acyl-CoA reductase [Capnocytophaga sp.]